MTFTRKSIRVLIVPYIFTVIIFFLLSMLQEVGITREFNWPAILVDFAMDVGSITISFCFFYYLLNKIYAAESKLLSSNNSLSEANYELESFIYRASHDFRTPLTTMKGLLIMYEFDKDSDSAKQYLAMLKESTEMMDSRLLELTEIATNKNKMITSERINVASLLKELVQELRFTASLDKIAISIEGDQTISISSDTARLKILLRNILVNAVKYKDTAKNRHIIKISVVNENGQIIIRFWDNGIGIPDAMLPKVFEMFFRGTQLSNGSGLGLYIAKTIAITLQYDIQIESKQGEWTQVSVILPTENTKVMQSLHG